MIINSPTNVVDYGQYNSPRTSKTITTTREYDANGNLIKETVVETVYGAEPYTPTWWDQQTRSGGYIHKGSREHFPLINTTETF